MGIDSQATFLPAGAFPPRSLSAVVELRRQVRLFLGRQLDACLEPDPAHPNVAFKVGRNLFISFLSQCFANHVIREVPCLNQIQTSVLNVVHAVVWI